jgi:hypothetical protein
MEPRLFAIALAGTCIGAIVGAAIPTETERSIRGSKVAWRPFLNNSSLGQILNALLPIAVIGTIMTGVGVGILRAGKVYPLGANDRILLSGCIAAGAALAKWCRYRYWKPKGAWR